MIAGQVVTDEFGVKHWFLVIRGFYSMWCDPQAAWSRIYRQMHYDSEEMVTCVLCLAREMD